EEPDGGVVPVGPGVAVVGPGAGQLAVGDFKVVYGQADLVQVVLALQAGGGLADFLHRGQEQPDEDGDDGDDDQQLDQREGTPKSQSTLAHGTPFLRSKETKLSRSKAPLHLSPIFCPGSAFGNSPPLQ